MSLKQFLALDVISKALDVLRAIKAKGSLNEYRDGIEILVSKTTKGKLSAKEMRSQLNALIKEYSKLAYLEGMKEGGIKKPDEEFDDSDSDEVETWTSYQLGFTANFSKDCELARGDETLIDGVLVRVDDWVKSLEALRGLGIISAKENTPATFKLGSTKEHCDTCRGLNGKRRRLKWWKEQGLLPQTPGNKNFDCECWECQCHLDDDDGKQIYP